MHRTMGDAMVADVVAMGAGVVAMCAVVAVRRGRRAERDTGKSDGDEGLEDVGETHDAFLVNDRGTTGCCVLNERPREWVDRPHAISMNISAPAPGGAWKAAKGMQREHWQPHLLASAP